MLARTDWIAGHSHNLSKHNDLVHRARPESLVRADSLTVRVRSGATTTVVQRRPFRCPSNDFRSISPAPAIPCGVRPQITRAVCEPIETIYLLSLPRQMSADVFLRRDP